MSKVHIEGMTEHEILHLALIGLEQIHKEHVERMQALRAKLEGNPIQKLAAAEPVPQGKRKLTPTARANIIAAQKKRWAKVRKGQRAAERAAQDKALARSAKRSRKPTNQEPLEQAAVQ